MTARACRAARGTYAPPLIFALILALGLLLTACDAGDATDAAALETTDTATLASAVAGLAEDAGASPDELYASARSFEGRHLEPGVLWTVAAEVHAQLTAEQIARLEATLEARRAALEARRDSMGDRPRGMHGPRGVHGPRGPHGGADGTPLFDRVLTGDLALTDAQQTAIEAIREAYRAEFEALRASDLPDDERRAQARALAEALRAEIDAVLTEAQRAALEARRAEMEERRAAFQAAERAAMAEALDLTDTQQADLDALYAEMEAQRGTVPPHEARDTFRAALAEILDDTQEEIVTVHAALRMHLRGTGMRGGPGAWGSRGHGSGGPHGDGGPRGPGGPFGGRG